MCEVMCSPCVAEVTDVAVPHPVRYQLGSVLDVMADRVFAVLRHVLYPLCPCCHHVSSVLCVTADRVFAELCQEFRVLCLACPRVSSVLCLACLRVISVQLN